MTSVEKEPLLQGSESSDTKVFLVEIALENALCSLGMERQILLSVSNLAHAALTVVT